MWQILRRLPSLPVQPLLSQRRTLICLRTRIGRGYKHRWATLKNLLGSLIEHERIKTTQAKAWELRRVADRVVQLGKKGNRKEAGKYVKQPHCFIKLFTIFAERYRERQGGYTRVLNRPG